MWQSQSVREDGGLLVWINRLAAIGAFLTLVVSAVAVWIGTSRGFDLTDEGIYLATARAFRRPELTFTGAPGVLGPLFQAVGWSIPALRRAKLIAFLVTSAALGCTVERVLVRRTPTQSDTDWVRTLWFVSLVTVGGLSVYSLLPQSPGYNDLAILLAMAAVIVTLRALAEGPGVASGFGLGLIGILLFLVKFPSAVMIGAGCLAVLVIRRRTPLVELARTLGIGAGFGAATGLGLLQLLSGNVVARAQAVFRANNTAVQGQSLSKSYVDIYLSAAGSIFRSLAPLVVLLGIAAVVCRLVARRMPWAACAGYVAMSAAVMAIARQRSFFTGGQDHVETLQNAFPLLTAIVLLGGWSLRPSANLSEGVIDDRHRGDLRAGVALLVAAPTLQAIGTGNTPFAIAASAGAMWTAALYVVLYWKGGVEGPRALAGLALATLVGAGSWLLGAPALWLTPFRLSGDLRDQTAVVRGVPRLAGVRTDSPTAEFLSKAHAELAARKVLGEPGFSSFAGVGLAYALELDHPPAGIYIDEPLAAVLKGRLADACAAGAIGPERRPVVLTDASRYGATAGALGDCGIDFPDGYEQVTLASPPFLDRFGIRRISLWTPMPE